MSLISVFKRIDDDLGLLFPQVAEDCKALLGYIFSKPKMARNHIHFMMLVHALNKGRPEDILPSLQYLTGASCHVLEFGYEFFDDDDSPIPIDPKDLVESRMEGVFYHPYKGTPVSNYENRIVFFIKVADGIDLDAESVGGGNECS